MEIQEINSFADISREEWNSLLNKSEVNEIFLTYEWLSTVYEAYYKRSYLLILLAKEGGQLAGIAPLVIENGVIRFAGMPYSDYNDFIISENKEKVLAAIFEYINKNIEFKKIELAEIKEDSSTLKILRRLEYRRIGQISDICPKVIISGDFKAYTKSDMGKSSRETLQLLTNRFTKNNGTFRYLEEAGEDFLNNFFETHKKQWSQTLTPSKFNDEQHRDFYTKITKRVNCGWYVLELDKKDIAYLLGFVYDNKFKAYTSAYEPEFHRYSPSSLAIYNLMREAFEKGLKEFDFLRGAEGYKNRFANKIDTNYRITIYKKSYFNAVYLKDLFVYASKRLLRKTGFLSRLARGIRARVRYIRWSGEHHKP